MNEPSMTQSSGGDSGSSAGMSVFREVSESSTTSTPPAQTQETPVAPAEPQTPQEPAQPQVPVQQQPQQPQLTPEAIAEAVALRQQQPQQPQQPEYTEEQFKKDFGIVEIDKPLMDAMFGMDSQPEQVEAMNQLVKQIVSMSLRMADHRTNQTLTQRLGPITQQLTPLQEKYKEYQNSQFTQQFYTKYQHLKNFNPIIKNVISNLQLSGQKFKTADEAMQAIASQTESMLSAAGVAITPQQPQQPVQQQQRPGGPAVVSTGGGVGATPAASSTPVSKGMAVFK